MKALGKYQVPAAIGVMLLGLFLCLAARASADDGLARPGGVFVPADAARDVMRGRDAPADPPSRDSGRWRVGAEIEGDEAPAEIGDPERRNYEAIRLRPMVTYALRPDGVTPYVGGGMELKMDPEAYGPPARTQPVGVAGIRVPVSDRIRLFTEGRWRPETGSSADVGSREPGRVRALGGVEIRF